jgi:HPt (histidine-containing phosphotransfer) domain-containing protein
VTLHDDLTEVLVRHRGWLAVRLEEIAACMEASLSPAAQTGTKLGHALEIVHQIKGTSGSIGFREVSSAAEALEAHLKSLAARRDADTPDEATARAWDLLARLQEDADRAEPERSTLLTELGE